MNRLEFLSFPLFQKTSCTEKKEKRESNFEMTNDDKCFLHLLGLRSIQKNYGGSNKWVFLLRN